MSRKSELTYDGNAAIDGHLVPWYFITNGGSDPVEYSSNIESVNQVTSDGLIPMYRVRLCRALRIDGRNDIAQSYTVVQAGGTNLDAWRVTTELIGTVPPEEGLEFDVVVVDLDVAPPAKDNTTTGYTVTGMFFTDQAG